MNGIENDVAALTIGGTSLVSLTALVTQFLKDRIGLSGRGAEVLALFVAAVHTAIAVAVRDGFYPQTASFWSETVPFWYAASWLVGLSAMGAYRLVTRKEEGA